VSAVRGPQALDPRQVIEASRNMARHSRDYMIPELKKLGVTEAQARSQITARMDLVLDCYLTGAAEMLKMLFGDFESEPWTEEYDHEVRLRELLATYGLLGVVPGAMPKTANRDDSEDVTSAGGKP